jgi:hypothetical protein
MSRPLPWLLAFALFAPNARAEVADGTSSLYDIKVTATPRLRKGAKGSVLLSVVPRRGAHIKSSTPFEARLKGPDFIALEKTTLVNSDVKYAGDSARVEVPFTAVSPGSASIEVSVEFVVCTDVNCFRMNVPVMAPVKVR